MTSLYKDNEDYLRTNVSFAESDASTAEYRKTRVFLLDVHIMDIIHPKKRPNTKQYLDTRFVPNSNIEQFFSLPKDAQFPIRTFASKKQFFSNLAPWLK